VRAHLASTQPGLLPFLHATSIGLPTLPVSAFADVTPAAVARIFPATPLAHISANLPCVLSALAAQGLTDRPILFAALATIRAEAECFEPITEQPSHFNTSPGGTPFNLYDHRADLGNQGPPDGARFCGRGFVQLTGRANYAHYASTTGLPLLAEPAIAARPAPAATLLAHFLADRQTHIRHALATGDLAEARRLVNGGTNGLDRFTSAIRLASTLLA
jgi:putative chitinase